MLVEDNETNRIVATDNLRRFGLAVSIARDGQEAVEQVKTHRFDLILMDLQMPVMDGFEATAAIRARDTEVPIIALSAAVMEQDRQRTEAVSMQGRLTKPIDVALLHATLARFLPESQTPVPAAPDDALPAIPGVNVDALTARMGGGRTKTIRGLLQSFVAGRAELLAKLDDTQPDTPPFYALIHNLKGTSGNLSLIDVHRLAALINAERDDGQQSARLPARSHRGRQQRYPRRPRRSRHPRDDEGRPRRPARCTDTDLRRRPPGHFDPPQTPHARRHPGRTPRPRTRRPPAPTIRRVRQPRFGDHTGQSIDTVWRVARLHSSDPDHASSPPTGSVIVKQAPSAVLWTRRVPCMLVSMIILAM